MIKSVNELLNTLKLSESLVVKMTKANTPPTWSAPNDRVDGKGFELKAFLTIEDGFLQGLVTEIKGEAHRKIVQFLYDLTESVPVLAEGELYDRPSTNQHAMLGEFADQVSQMGAVV